MGEQEAGDAGPRSLPKGEERQHLATRHQPFANHHANARMAWYWMNAVTASSTGNGIPRYRNLANMFILLAYLLTYLR